MFAAGVIVLCFVAGERMNRLQQKIDNLEASLPPLLEQRHKNEDEPMVAHEFRVDGRGVLRVVVPPPGATHNNCIQALYWLPDSSGAISTFEGWR